jgi:diguanylate cyclase (GGDEF)-like protein
MAQEFLARAKEIIRSSASIDTKIPKYTTLLSEFLDGAVVSILLFDSEVEEFFLGGSTLNYKQGSDSARFTSSGTVDALSLVEKRVISLREVNRPSESKLKAEYYAVPMIAINELVGVVSIQYVAGNGLEKEKFQTLQESVDQLADVISSAIREETISQRMTKIAAINEAGVNIISTLDLNRLLKLVGTSASLIMEAESCLVRLLDDETGKYTIREFYGLKEEEVQKKLFQLDRSVVVEVLKSGMPVHIRDLAEREEYREFDGFAKTLICNPMMDGGEIIGTVTIFDKFTQKTFYPIPFSSDDALNFEKFIRYSEKAVSNAIVFERNERLKNVDDVTGLPNLKYFQGRLMTELNRAKRFKKKLVLMICEIIPHVTFSDFYVKGKGDQVVRSISRTIRDTLREYDVVARISENKFGIILPEAEDGKISAIPRVKGSIEKEMERLEDGGKGLKVDIKFGQAIFPDDGEDYEKLIFKTNILKL